MEQTTENKLIIFKLGDEEFGIGIQDVREIMTVPEITKIPNTEDYIIGIINLREKIIVVLDLEKKLKLLPAMNTKERRIIIIEIDCESVGILVDSCNQVLRVNEDQIEKAPKTITKKIGVNYLSGVGKIEGRLIILLNMNNLFEAKTMEKIHKISSTSETIIEEKSEVEVSEEKPLKTDEEEIPKVKKANSKKKV